MKTDVIKAAFVSNLEALKNMSAEEIETFVSKPTSEHARVIWNAAIEAAAVKVNDEMGHDEMDTWYVEREIRKLKK